MGGASVHLLDLAVGLVKKNYEVHILCGGNGILIDNASLLNLKISSVQSLVRDIDLYKDFKAFFEIKKLILAYSPDLVHLHSSKAGLLGRLVCHSLNIPCVFTAHGWSFTEGVSKHKRWLYLLLERIASKFSSKIITVSDYDKNLALDNDVAMSSKLITIHNGVTDKSHSLGLVKHSEKEVIRIIMVARFEKQKDHLRLLNALSKVKAKNWHLEFVGDGPEILTAKKLCNSLGFQNVTFSGSCSDVPKRLNSSDIFVLLSHWEGLPLTILEAMSVGLPIIASDVGGVKETLDERCGFLIPSSENQFLIDSLTKLIFSADLRADMGHASRVRYEKLFTLDRMVSDVEKVYRNVISKI